MATSLAGALQGRRSVLPAFLSPPPLLCSQACCVLMCFACLSARRVHTTHVHSCLRAVLVTT